MDLSYLAGRACKVATLNEMRSFWLGFYFSFIFIYLAFFCSIFFHHHRPQFFDFRRRSSTLREQRSARSLRVRAQIREATIRMPARPSAMTRRSNIRPAVLASTNFQAAGLFGWTWTAQKRTRSFPEPWKTIFFLPCAVEATPPRRECRLPATLLLRLFNPPRSLLPRRRTPPPCAASSPGWKESFRCFCPTVLL